MMSVVDTIIGMIKQMADRVDHEEYKIPKELREK